MSPHYLAEMYPECIIASWDPLIFLLDTENIEQRVPLDAENKIECFRKIINASKKRHHTICKFVFHEYSFHNLIDFAITFQTEAEKPLNCLITFLSRLCLVT